MWRAFDATPLSPPFLIPPVGRFDADGIRELSFLVPSDPMLTGHELGFLGFALGRFTGKVFATEEETVAFE